MYSLEHNITRLSEDHRRAKEIGDLLSTLPFIAKVEPVETNIVIFNLTSNVIEKTFLNQLKSKNIHISSMGQGKLRMVTHLDYKEVMHEYVLEALSKMQL